MYYFKRLKKPLVCAFALIISTVAAGSRPAAYGDILGRSLPPLKALRLDRSEVLLPDICLGKVALLALGYKRDSQYTIEKWLAPARDEFRENARFDYFQIPMLAGLGAKVFSRAIIKGIASTVSEEDRKHYLISFHQVKKYRQTLRLSPDTDTFIIILDSEGNIRWMGQGPADEAAVQSMLGVCRQLLGSSLSKGE